LMSSRALHEFPEASSGRCAVAKKVVGELASDVIRWCGEVQSADPATRGDGVIDTLVLHNGVIGYLDATPLQNLKAITSALLTMTADASLRSDETPISGLRRVCTLDEPLPALRPDAMSVIARSADPFIGRLEPVARSIARLLPDSPLVEQVESLVGECARLFADIEDFRTRSRKDKNLLLDLTERFSYLYGAALCMHLWFGSRHLPLYGAEPGETGWLVAVLSLLLRRAAGRSAHLPAAEAEQSFAVVDVLRQRGSLFAAVPVPLSESERKVIAQPDNNHTARLWKGL